MRRISCLAAVLSVGLAVANADDGLGLKRGANPNDVSISGVSSGAAMAIQYAVAHSKSIVGVGAIAGPQWGCADGSITEAVNDCMCGRAELKPKIRVARQLSANGKIDSLSSRKPEALNRSYVFHSPADTTVVKKSAAANIAFLTKFIGATPQVDWGNPVDGSDKAGHGIISPEDGNDPCQADGNEVTYIRRCGAEDNAGKMFNALFGQGSSFDPSKRVNDIPDSDVWQFDQSNLIDEVKALGSTGAPDSPILIPTSRRQNFDLADKGGASDNHAVARAFGDETALELSDCPEDMEYQLAGRRRRVDFLFQGQERDALFLESFDDIEKFAERAPQSIQANDGESVAGTNVEE